MIAVECNEKNGTFRNSQKFYRLPSLVPTPAKATSASVTTLSNGLSVVTEDSCTLSSMTLTYPKAGSANESIGEHGAAFVNRFMNFKSASGMSTIYINRAIENCGGFPFTTVDRNSAVLGFTVVPEKAIALVPLLAATSNSNYEKWDIYDSLKLAEEYAAVSSESAQVVLTEHIFAAAYGPQTPAGRPFHYPSPDKRDVVSFRSKAYGLHGAVLAVTGVKDHSAFVTETESLLSSFPAGDVTPAAPIIYLGGESRAAAPKAAFAHVALAFPAPTSSVLVNIVKKVLDLVGMESGVSSFSASGLLGTYFASTTPETMVDTMVEVLKKSTTSNVFARAKKLAKADALLAIDGGSLSLANYMTASVLESGTFVPGSIGKAYDSVTDAQVKDAVAMMLKSKLSMAAIGNISSVPYVATVSAQLS